MLVAGFFLGLQILKKMSKTEEELILKVTQLCIDISALNKENEMLKKENEFLKKLVKEKIK